MLSFASERLPPLPSSRRISGALLIARADNTSKMTTLRTKNGRKLYLEAVTLQINKTWKATAPDSILGEELEQCYSKLSLPRSLANST